MKILNALILATHLFKVQIHLQAMIQFREKKNGESIQNIYFVICLGNTRINQIDSEI
jgi:hypothetical protein